MGTNEAPVTIHTRIDRHGTYLPPNPLTTLCPTLLPYPPARPSCPTLLPPSPYFCPNGSAQDLDVDLGAACFEGKTPAYFAALHNSRTILNALADLGVSLSAVCCEEGYAPAYIAAQAHCIESLVSLRQVNDEP